MTWRRAAWIGAVLPVVLTGAGSPAHDVGPASLGPPSSVLRPEWTLRSKDTLTFAYEVSGLRVIQRVRPGSNVVAVRLYLLGGCRQLSSETAGIEALWLTTSGLGTEHFPGALTQRAMARTGGREVLEALADWTVFGFDGLRQDFAESWRVFADQLLFPTLTEVNVSQARKQLISEAARRDADPEWRVRALAAEVTFAGHPYGLDPEGTQGSLERLTADMVSAYAREQLVTSRLLLVVVGDVDRLEVERLVAGTLGRLPRGDYRWTLPPPIPEQQGQWLAQQSQTSTNYILAYFPGPAATDRDYAAFRVATSLLSGQLQSAIRFQRSLSYAAYAPFMDRAVAIGGLYATTSEPEEVVPLMVEEIEKLQGGLVSRLSLERFLNGYLIEYLTDNATSAGQADALARAQVYFGDYRFAGDYLKRLRAVNPEDVHQVAVKYMSRTQYAYLGDTTKMSGIW